MTEGRPATIYLAAEEGKVEEVQRYIREGQDINTPDSFGQCPLHYAAVFGRVEVIEALLTAGASVNCETANGTRPLHYAARNGQADCVEKLAARGAEANAKDREGWTPLHYACFRGHQRSAQALLSHGAAVNEPNTQGHTALHLACNRGFIDVAVALIQAGADLAATSKRGEPPLAFLPLQEKAPMMYLTSADLGTAGLREAMLAMLRDGLHSDVSVRVASAPAGSSPLRAHRCVLAARSPALREALSANPDLREIEVKDAGETAVRWFLEWCYAGSLPPVFHERPTATETVLSAIELLQLARYYAPAADDIRRAAQPIVANNITEPVARRLWAVIGPDVDSWRPISDHLISTVIRTASSATAHDLLDPLRAVPPNKLTAILKDLPIKVPEQPKPAAPVAAAPVVAAAPPLATPVAPVAASRAAAAAPPAPPLPPPPPPAAAAVPAPYLMPYTGPIVPAPAPSTRIVPFTVAATCPPVVQMQIDRTNKVIGARLDVPMTAADVGMCRKIADTLNKHKNSFFFRKPVDPIRDGIPSYYSVIKDPIDLQTLKKHLETGKYQTLSQFLGEARRVWQNAMVFNQPNSDAFKYATELAGVLEKAATKQFGSAATEKVPESKKRKASSMSSPPAEAGAEKTSPMAVSPPEADAGRMSPVTQEAVSTQPAVPPQQPQQPPPTQEEAPAPIKPEAVKPVASTPAAAPAQEVVPLTLQELEELGTKIGRLDTASLTAVLQLANITHSEGELELDLSTISHDTLRAMQRYINQVLDDLPDAKRPKV